MDFRRVTKLILLCVFCALAGAYYSRRSPASNTVPGVQVALKMSSEDPALPANTSPPSQFKSFEERMADAPSADSKDAADRSRRAAVLIEWLGSDRRAALQFLAKNRFKDIWLPGLAKAIGTGATAAELLFIANSSDNSADTISEAGKWAGLEAVNGLAGLMASVSTDAAPRTALAVAGLLTAVNVDRGFAFAMSQTDENVRSYAISGVFTELRSGPNGDTAVRSLYSTLPPATQNSDAVRFGYGTTTWGSDPVAALQTLEGISAPQMRMAGLLYLSGEAASSSPETAIAAIYASGISSQGIFNHVNPIIQKWSAVDPQAASSFLATTQIIPGGDLAKYAPALATHGGP